ncbi:MAG: rRNA pseudouridine synthase [Phycisphaerales bacterium]|nr:rRNA pseudouridine synthase [Phycisphaerales bacterium]
MVRLQRVLADAGVAARRVCEQLIEEGRVEVNGRVITRLPVFVDPHQDKITVDGRPLRPPERRLYVMLHKPTRTLSTATDQPGSDRRTVTQLVDHPAGARLFPVGRLDYDATGLMLLTNDGELANRLTHPRYGLPQVYQAVIKGEPDEAILAKLEGSAVIAERKRRRREDKEAGRITEEVRGSKVELRVAKREAGRSVVQIRLVEGPNREIRHLLAKIGCPVKKLTRLAIGPLRLSGLPLGGWRELERSEIQALRRAAFGKGPKDPPQPGQARPRLRREGLRRKPGEPGEPSSGRSRPGIGGFLRGPRSPGSARNSRRPGPARGRPA